MKTYKITVNGVAYEVTVEEMGAGYTPAAPVAAAPAPAAPVIPTAPAASAAPAPTPAPASAGKTGSTVVKAPMPGNIMKVSVKVGDSVKKGDILCILEAMKMENEIVSPVDGTVASVEVSQGETVATDATLISLN